MIVDDCLVEGKGSDRMRTHTYSSTCIQVLLRSVLIFTACDRVADSTGLLEAMAAGSSL